MFHDLDATVAALVESELAMENVAISFAAPDDQFPPSSVSLPAIAFFLYDVRENYELRTSTREVGRQPNGTATRKRPSARVDCSYLITAWPSESSPNPPQDEHRLLGEVMKVLLRHRSVPDTYLRGELVGQDPPVPTRIIAEAALPSLGEFWQAMGGKPKGTLRDGLTLSIDVFEPVVTGREVNEKVIRISHDVPKLE